MPARHAIAVLLAGWAAVAGRAADDPPLPPGSVARLGSPRMRVAKNVHRLQFSPDGRWLVAADREEVRGWDPATGRVLFRFDYPKGEASVSDGRVTTAGTVVMLVRDGRRFHVRHLDPRNPASARTVPVAVTESTAATFDPGGKLLAVVRTAGDAARLELFDADRGGDPRWSVELTAKPADGMAFAPDGGRLFVPFEDGVRVVAAADGAAVRTLADGEKTKASGVLVSADGRRVAAEVGGDDAVAVWDADSGRRLRRLAPAARPLGFLPGSNALAVAHADGVAVYDDATGAKLRGFEVAPAGSAALSPDGRTIATHADDAVILIDAGTGRPLPHAADPPGLPQRLRFDGDGRLVGELTKWGGWARWDPATGAGEPLRPPAVGEAVPVGLSADGRLALYRTDAAVQVRETAGGRTVLAFDAHVRADQPLAGLTADGRTAVVAGHDELTVLAVGGGRRVVRRPAADHGPPQLLAVSPDGRLAAVDAHAPAAERQQVQVIDLAAGAIRHSLPTDGPAFYLAFSADGGRLAVGVTRFDERSDSRFAAAVFDTDAGRPLLRTPAEPSDGQPRLDLSADGRVLLRIAGNGAGTAWEVASGKPRATPAVGPDVHAAALAADGRTLAVSVPGRGPVLLFDLLGEDRRAAAAPADGEWEAAWAALAGEPAAAYRAARRLAAGGDRAAAFLKAKLPPAAAPDAAKLARWVADLEARSYAARERAARQLHALGELAEPALRRAAAGSPSPEARRRAEDLLAAIGSRPTPDRLRTVRAIEVLEWVGRPSSRAVLADLAAGAEGGFQTREAKAALGRGR